jgi:hypothetical protein
MIGTTNRNAAYTGSRIYSKPVLSLYDLVVMGFSNRFVWKCPTQLLVDFYNKHVSENHLDVGVGTAYLLDKCQFPSREPNIVLADLNVNSLKTAVERIERYHPMAYRSNVLKPQPFASSRFDSVGVNYLLHCLPGTMTDKGIVFENLKPLLHDGGVIFGTTILGRGVEQNALAKVFMRGYNAVGAFSNTQDDRESLQHILKKNFRDYSIHVVGCAAIFVGRT